MAAVASLTACGQDGDSGSDAVYSGALADGQEATQKNQAAPTSGDFEMTVMDSFTAAGRNAIVTGRVTSGEVSDTICLVSREQGSKQYVVGGIAKSGKEVESVAAPNMVGIELKP